MKSYTDVFGNLDVFKCYLVERYGKTTAREILQDGTTFFRDFEQFYFDRHLADQKFLHI